MSRPSNIDLEDSASGIAALRSLLDPMLATLKKSFPISEAELDVLYNVGVKLYQLGKWEEASRFFAAVTVVDPLNPTYLSAQGKCLKMMKDFDGAYQVFHLAWDLDKQTPEPALHAAEALMLADRKREAAAILQTVLSLHYVPAMDKRLREKAEAWSSLLALGTVYE